MTRVVSGWGGVAGYEVMTVLVLMQSGMVNLFLSRLTLLLSLLFLIAFEAVMSF